MPVITLSQLQKRTKHELLSDEEALCMSRTYGPWVSGGILTVRFTYREEVIRICGAGYWRKGKRIYERENQVHGRAPRKPKGRS